MVMNSPDTSTADGAWPASRSPTPSTDGSLTGSLPGVDGSPGREEPEAVSDSASSVEGAEEARQPGYRSYLLYLLPTAIVFATVAVLVWSRAPEQAPRLQDALNTARHLTLRDAALLLAAAAILSLILQPLQFPLIRAFEGYWGGRFPGRVLASVGIAWQRGQRGRWRDAREVSDTEGTWRSTLAALRQEAASERLEEFPEDGRILPTRLGNILRAAEDRAGSRHGLGAVIAWPRLYPLLDGRMLLILLEHRYELDLQTRLSAAFVLDAAIATAFLRNYGWWNLIGLGLLALAWLSYRAALAAAKAYGTTVEAAFDLHRFQLLKALHLGLPPDGSTERRLNELVSEYLAGQDGWSLDYRHEEQQLVRASGTIPLQRKVGGRRGRPRARRDNGRS
jgi:hypothetical protein